MIYMKSASTESFEPLLMQKHQSTSYGSLVLLIVKAVILPNHNNGIQCSNCYARCVFHSSIMLCAIMNSVCLTRKIDKSFTLNLL